MNGLYLTEHEGDMVIEGIGNGFRTIISVKPNGDVHAARITEGDIAECSLFDALSWFHKSKDRGQA